ncbi:ABC transporter permease [Dactylosporangium sp. NPDC005572]|uniref:ABC transporter permease n=1 Tax=Dactylosporangium sp. NPDC005572 TaxID=3156889 RepID=UPI0033B21D78
MRQRPARARPRLSVHDLLSEALAGILQRPGRAAFTALGTVLGVGAFVAVVGLTATAGSQISKRFNALMATEVTVEAANQEGTGTTNPFPQDADALVRAINGVVDGGVWWVIDDQGKLPVTGVPIPGARASTGTPILAASPGLVRALRPTLREGRLYDDFHDARAEQVVVLGAAAAHELGVASLAGHPAVFIDGIPFTVVGILDGVARQADTLFSVLVPQRTAASLWGVPSLEHHPKMLIETRAGAAGVTAAQVATALRPDAPDLFKVTAPPDPTQLRDQISSDLWMLFILLAGVCLVIGAVGIANTTMVAVLERVPEIGLRRSLGAQRHHIGAQFMLETAMFGTAGGLIGTSVGVVTVVLVSLVQRWTAVLHPAVVLTAPLIGTLVGLLAGIYPAWRAAKIEPVEALRR